MFKPIKTLLLTLFEKPEKLSLNLGRIEIKEAQIKYDFELLDRYQKYSSEILRLSLIGIGAYAFLLKEGNGDFFRLIANNPTSKYFSVGSIASFALAVACTLIHR